MLNWQQVRSVCRWLMTDSVSEDTLDRFLDAAELSRDGQRLTACLLIDIASGSLTPTVAKGPLESASTAPNAVLGFAIAVESASNENALICASARRGTNLHDRYVRVMEMSSFITYFAGVTRNLTLNAEDVVRVRAEYFSDPPAATLGDISVTWSGYNQVVWIMPLDDFDDITKGDGDTAATELNDQLGLGYTAGTGENGKPEVIAVKYPPQSQMQVTCDTCQPTTLDAYWKGANFFVSAPGSDGWGQTHPCSGFCDGFRERVHRALPALSDAFSAQLVGVAAVRPQNRDELLRTAFTRLEQVIESMT